MAARGKTAADLGASICFEDEAGKTMIPPRARTWGRRGHTPVVRVAGSRGGRLSMAGMLCYRAGRRARLLFRLHRYHRRKGEEASLTWRDYRAFLQQAHQELGTPIVLVWDNLNRHTCAEMSAFIQATEWLRVFQLPSYAPDLNPVEGIWSMIVRGPLANLAVASIDELDTVVRRELKSLQYRPTVLIGCLAEIGLRLNTSNTTT